VSERRGARAWRGARVYAWVMAADRFVRLHLLFFTVLWPLLGVATVESDPTAHEITVILAVMVCFHVFAYVSNDLVDRAVDATDPRRQQDPLVRGDVRPWQALAVVVLQPLVAIWLTAGLGAGMRAYPPLITAFVLMACYNLWGKRCIVPPLTDAAQGLAWGSLAVYGSAAVGASPTGLTWTVTAYAAIYTMFINGIHGSLRDLRTDRDGGARTTAMFLGARPLPHQRGVQVPFVMALYSWAILAAMIGILAVLLVRNDPGYGPVPWAVTSAIVGACSLAACVLQPRVVGPRGFASDVEWRLQMWLTLMSFPIALAASTPIDLLVVLAAFNGLSLALFATTGPVIRWVWQAARSLLYLQTPFARGADHEPT
jgi:4-hydroxybenzoate polyprenyltransferase